MALAYSVLTNLPTLTSPSTTLARTGSCMILHRLGTDNACEHGLREMAAFP